MQLEYFKTKDAFLSYVKGVSKRVLIENLISSVDLKNNRWYYLGYCQVCESARKFLVDWKYSDKININFRERLVCEFCKLNNRQRFMAKYLKDEYLKIKDSKIIIYLYEQVTPFYQHVTELFPEARVIGSEYLGYEKKSGEIIRGLRHEDALCMSFDNNSINLIASNDVYEHVPDINQALKEAYRVLRPSGKLIFSIPFHPLEEHSVQRAELEKDGAIKYYKDKLHHGNPVSKDGSLVFYDFGWDILDSCTVAGFDNAYMIGYYSHMYGYLGGGLQFVFVAEKNQLVRSE